MQNSVVPNDPESSAHQPWLSPFQDSDRVTLLVATLFICSVLAIPKFNIEEVIPFAAFPVFVITLAKVPAKVIVKRQLLLSPFMLFMAAGNLVLDRTPRLLMLGMTITGGMLSGTVIVAKTSIIIAGILAITQYLPFYRICNALSSLGLPEILVTQLTLLNRYLSVIHDEALSIQRARDSRSFGNKGKGILNTASLLGTLLLRSQNRAERIYRAMSARGFDKRITKLSVRKLTAKELRAVGVWFTLFLALRLIF
ncbi:MAG: energy-coupling factor transporter transmembrane component T family protein [Chlorobium sp.]